MKPKNSFIIFLPFILLTFPYLISSQTCQRTCGQIPIQYPFGTGPGCGDPRFQPYVTCNNQQLTLATQTGYYMVTSIDYNNRLMFISDPTMSTCSSTQPSRGFGLDSGAPFSFHTDTLFALLECSTTSPIYRGVGGLNSTIPTCGSPGGSICSRLYSCEPISRLSLSVSTCCVYKPVDLGPSFVMDLQKLQCASYAAMFGLTGQDMDPRHWKYELALMFDFNFDNDYHALCAKCERSNGVCGRSYSLYNSFSCTCPGGFNTATDCFYGGNGYYWSYGSRIHPWQGTPLLFLCTWFVIFTYLWN